MARATVAVLLAAMLTACAKPVPDHKLDYVGEWRSPEMRLLILADGSIAYERFRRGATTSVEGPLKGFDGNDFSVGIGPFSTTFVVSEPPHRLGGEWQMVVDGVRLTRVSN